MLNELSWWRAMPIGLSCLLHVGLVTGLIAGQQWVTSVVALQPPVLPVQLVTLDAVEPPREIAPPAPPGVSGRPRSGDRSPRGRGGRRREGRGARPAARRAGPGARRPRRPSRRSRRLRRWPPCPPSASPRRPRASSAPAASSPTVALPASAPIVAAKPSSAAPEGITRTARPQGGYQVRPAYPSAPGGSAFRAPRMLRVHVLADGRIGDVLVEHSAGHPDLDQAAIGRGAALALRAGPPRRRRRWPCGCCSPSNSGSAVRRSDAAPSSVAAAARSVALILTAIATAQPRPETTLPPVVVEGSRAPDERTRTETEAREELRRVPGGTEMVDQKKIEQSRGGQSQGRARLRAGRVHAPALRRGRREPDLDPRLGPAQQLPPARRQRPDRRLPLRQRRRLQRLRVARAADHQAHRGLQGRQRAALRRLHPRRRHQPRHQDRLRRRRSSRCGARRGSFGFFKNYIGTGQVYGPVRPLRRPERHGAERATGTTASRSGAAPTAPSAIASPGAPRSASTSATSRTRRTCPARSPSRRWTAIPRQQNPATSAFKEERNYDYTRGALTVRTPLGENQVLEWFTQLNYQDLDHPLSFAIIDDTTYSYGTELRYVLTAPFFGLANRLTAGFQFFGTRQIDVNFPTTWATAAPRPRTSSTSPTTTRSTPRTSSTSPPPSPRWREAGSTTPLERCAIASRSNGNQSDSVDFFSASPRVGFVWKVAPTVQVFGNASHAYEPPAAPRADRARPDRRQPGPARTRRSPGSSRWAPAATWASGSPGTSRSTTSSCGTRSRT